MTLSVLIPNYNQGHYLSNALEAIVNQSLKPNEIIIVDDASVDNSIEIIERFRKKYPYIVLYRNDTNKGAVYALNRALDCAKGTYVACCASDDQILPGFFEESIALLKKNPTAGFCSSQYSFFYDGEDKIHVRKSLLSKELAYLSPQDFFKALKFKDIRIGGQNIIFDREKMVQAGKFLPEMSFLCDWFLIAVLGLRHGACFIPKPLTKLRVHKNSFSQSNLKNKKKLIDILEKLDTILSKPTFDDIKVQFLISGLVYQLGLHFHPVYFQKKYRKFMTPAWAFHNSIDFLKHCKHRLKCRF